MEIVTDQTAFLKEKDLVNIASKIGPVISQYVNEEENNGRLSSVVVETLRGAGFFKLFLPKSLGGLEADPVTTAKVIEEVARHNTAAGWSLMVTNTTLFSTSNLSEQGIEEIFGSDSSPFIAGSIHPPMRATSTEGGYLINGRNPLVSNVHEANWILVTALVMEGEQPKLIDGHPQIMGIIMKASDCEIIETWRTLGMRATDSNDVEANNVFVPDHLAFPLVPDPQFGQHYKSALYRFPVAGANLACLLPPVILAVARNAIDELKVLAGKKTPLGSRVSMKERGVVQRKLGRAEALVQSSRAFLYDTISRCWSKTLSGQTISLEEKANLLLAATHANQSCVEAVELAYTASGSTGVYLKNKLAHYFTDAQVMRQHGFMNESRYETAGQIYFGLPSDLPLIEF
jgi:alkylation response protein AidB-like acyl-CoA dehydrogenase